MNQYNSLQYSSLQHSSLQHTSLQHSSLQYSSLQYKTLMKLIGIIGLALSTSACYEKSKNEAGQANSLKSAPSYKLQNFFPGISFRRPLAMLPHPDRPNLWYIVEQKGKIFLVETKGSTPKKTLFTDISQKVDARKNESGLLGMAFHPNFSTNGYVFLSYTRSGDGQSSLISTISRYISPDNGMSLDNSSEKQVLSLRQPYANHNGGNIVFDANGYLMIGWGDGGAAGDPKNHAQNTRSLLGKLLRIDINTTKPYTIPEDNPFVGDENYRPEIYAWGLRNPWRWSFDKKNAELWLADVGQNEWEEINVIDAGKNYGWNILEGNHCYNSAACDTSKYESPVYEYNHDEGCSITGGYVYRGSKLANLQGQYVFGDYCSGKIWALDTTSTGTFQRRLMIKSDLNIASFSQGNDGEIYVIHHGGQIYAIEDKH